MKKSVSMRITMNIDKNLVEWIDDQLEKGEFDNQSAGIRKCIVIAKRVYETSTPEEAVKFIMGKNIE